MGNKCPVCGSSDIVDRSGLKRCSVCGLAWRAEQYFGNPAYAAGAEPGIYQGGKKVIFERAISALNSGFPARGRLLDIGAAYGSFMELARVEGWQTEGVEIDPKLAAHALAAGLKIYDRPVELLGLTAESYDAITVFEVLCLMGDPVAAVKEAYRLLKPGGRMYIREFNGAFHMALHDRWLFNVLGLRPSVLHNFNFTAESLRRLFILAGFRDIKIKNSVPTSGDPYHSGGTMSRFTGLAKKMFYIAAQAGYYASFGSVLASSAFIIEAKK